MNKSSTEKRSRGSVAVLMAVGAVALLGFAAIALDVGYALVTRAELQNVSDAGSMAGNNALTQVYAAKGNVDIMQTTLTSADVTTIKDRVNAYTIQNKAAGVPISVGLSDISIGKWNNGTFTPTLTGPNAVAVVARRDQTSNGAVSTLLAGVMGIESYSVKANAATSGVSGLRKVPKGYADIPVGISKAWFLSRNSPCGQDSRIRFYPTGDLVGCAGWHVFTDYPASASKLEYILNALQNHQYTAPESIADETFYNFTGGTVAADFKDMLNLYNSRKRADGLWTVHIPVYDYSDCSNPNGPIRIVGFATATVNQVDVALKQIWANVECKIVTFGEGGGKYYGTAVGTGSVVR